MLKFEAGSTWVDPDGKVRKIVQARPRLPGEAKGKAMKNEFNERTFYQIVCPSCREGFDGPNSSGYWVDKQQAEDVAMLSEWTEFGGSLYCPDCMRACPECDGADVPMGQTCPECGAKS